MICETKIFFQERKDFFRLSLSTKEHRKKLARKKRNIHRNYIKIIKNKC